MSKLKLDRSGLALSLMSKFTTWYYLSIKYMSTALLHFSFSLHSYIHLKQFNFIPIRAGCSTEFIWRLNGVSPRNLARRDAHLHASTRPVCCHIAHISVHYFWASRGTKLVANWVQWATPYDTKSFMSDLRQFCTKNAGWNNMASMTAALRPLIEKTSEPF